MGADLLDMHSDLYNYFLTLFLNVKLFYVHPNFGPTKEKKTILSNVY